MYGLQKHRVAKNGGLVRHAPQSQLTVNGLVYKRWKSKGRTPPQIHKNGAFRKRMSSFIDAMHTIHENSLLTS